MPYQKGLIRLRPARGFISDTPPHEVGPDFWTGCSNAIMREGFASRILGSRDAYTTALATAAPTQLMHAVNAEVSDTNYWLLFEDDGSCWSIEGSNAVDIDGSLLINPVANPFAWSSALLNGLPVISNGDDEPVYWAGANLITLPDWTATTRLSVT